MKEDRTKYRTILEESLLFEIIQTGLMLLHSIFFELEWSCQSSNLNQMESLLSRNGGRDITHKTFFFSLLPKRPIKYNEVFGSGVKKCAKVEGYDFFFRISAYLFSYSAFE